MSVGQRIKKMRTDADLTQTELAEECNISKQLLYKYENDIITNIPTDKIETLAENLNTTPEYLMGWTDDPYDWDRDPDARAASVPLSYVEGCGGNLQQAWKVMQAVERENGILSKNHNSEERASQIDPDIRRIERARSRMPEAKKQQMMKILEASMAEYFSDDFVDEDNDE